MAIEYSKIKTWATLFALIAPPIASIAVPIVLAIVGSRVQSSIHNAQVGADYIKLATNILSQQDQSEDLRKWAAEVFNHFTPVPVSKTLLNGLSSGNQNLPVAAVKTCPLQGDATSLFSQHLNVLKNRIAGPQKGEINQKISLKAILEPGNDAKRWSNNDAATITGYVIDVKPGGLETANCHATDLDSRDTHIVIALSRHAPRTERMVVEITPSWRRKMATQGVDWSTVTLEKTLARRWITITGWMFFDAARTNVSENTSPGGAANFLATAWEIHPVTAIAVEKMTNTP